MGGCYRPWYGVSDGRYLRIGGDVSVPCVPVCRSAVVLADLMNSR